MLEHSTNVTNRDEINARLAAVEQRLATMHETLISLQATNQRLVEQTSKLESEMRRARWWRWFWTTIRWLIVLGIIAALIYYFEAWQNLLQFFV
jgi:hypothetical protein